MELTNKVITAIDGLKEESNLVRIVFSDNTYIEQYHEQECCEYVEVSQVDGNVNKHIGATVISFTETAVHNSQEEFDFLVPDGGGDVSITATFYKLVTSAGYLDWRWQGESNGYYSESVTTELQRI